MRDLASRADLAVGLHVRAKSSRSLPVFHHRIQLRPKPCGLLRLLRVLPVRLYHPYIRSGDGFSWSDLVWPPPPPPARSEDWGLCLYLSNANVYWVTFFLSVVNGTYSMLSRYCSASASPVSIFDVSCGPTVLGISLERPDLRSSWLQKAPSLCVSVFAC